MKNIPYNKGEQGKECNRTVCTNTNARWFNHSTEKYYCSSCASLINNANPKFEKREGFPLCTLEK